MSINSVGSKCCGCRACLQKCNCQAISFDIDACGFEYPKIDFDLCVNCGLCEKVCPALNSSDSSETISCGMAYALDEKVKYNGSSGGMFGILAQSVIDRGGIVFGAAFDENLKLKTQSAESYEQLVPLYKSKYLLCDTSNQFGIIENELKKNRQVLYCSSPCQISALKLYLNKEYDNLLTVDFVCHGVGSQTLFDKSINYTEKKESIKIKKVVLRYKKRKASSHYYYYYYLKDGKYYEKSDLYFSFPYYNAYCKEIVYRDSCYDCQYAKRERVGDITIGDFHRVEKYFKNVDRFAGVSMILVNTEKGGEWFDIIKEKIHFESMDKETIYENNRFSPEVVIPAIQPAFRKSIAEDPFEITIKKFLRPSKDWKKLLYYKSPRFLRKIIMKIY